MDLTRQRELTVRMGEYETFKFSARVHASHKDLGISDEELESGRHVSTVAKQLQDLVADQLDVALQQDMEDAADLTADRKSFIRRAFASADTNTKDK